MSENKNVCPDCSSTRIVRNGRTRRGVQVFKCRTCGRQFVAHPVGQVPDLVEGIIYRMLHAGFSVRTISEITLISKGAIYARRQTLNG